MRLRRRGTSVRDELALRQRLEVSRIIFVNKLDRVGADFLRVVGQVEDILGANPLVMVLPIGIEDDFVGVVDLLSRKAHIWPDPGNPEKFELHDVPEDMVDLVEEWREKLVETAVEQDDDLMEAYLEGKPSSNDDIKRCIRKGTIALDFFPTYCGSAFKDKGIQLVLDAVVDFLADVGPQPLTDEQGEPNSDSQGGCRRTVPGTLKIMDDRFGALTFVGVYSSKIDKGDTMLNAFCKTERVGRMVEMHADDRNEIDSAQAKDIFAIVGAKNLFDGLRFYNPNNQRGADDLPDPVISIAVAPKDEQRRKDEHRRWQDGRGGSVASRSRPTKNSRRKPFSKAWASCTRTSKSNSSSAPMAWSWKLAHLRSPIAKPLQMIEDSYTQEAVRRFGTIW